MRSAHAPRRAGAPDNVYAEVEENFDAQEIVPLTLANVASNGCNRFAVRLRSPVGSYVRRESH